MYIHLSGTFDKIDKMLTGVILNVGSVFLFKNERYVCIFKYDGKVWTK